jgi:DNA-binding transcriptional ArsR family regulator
VKAVYIVDDPKVAKVLIDPMRRAILELLREKPMTQTHLAKELGLTQASLSYHIKLLKSKKLVNVFQKKAELHGIIQIYFSTSAYLYIYDLNSLPKDMSRYFYPIALERIRAVISVMLLYDDKYRLKKDVPTITGLSNVLSELMVKSGRLYINKEAKFGKENIIFDIYIKAIKDLFK